MIEFEDLFEYTSVPSKGFNFDKKALRIFEEKLVAKAKQKILMALESIPLKDSERILFTLERMQTDNDRLGVGRRIKDCPAHLLASVKSALAPT